MKKYIFAILFIACIITLSACAATEVLPPHLTRENGVLYLDIWSDGETGEVNTGRFDDKSEVEGFVADPNVQPPFCLIKFESIEDAIYRIYNNDFTEEQLKELSEANKRDENGRIEIFDVKWYSKMPAVRNLPLQWVNICEGNSSAQYQYESLDDHDIQCKYFNIMFHTDTDNFETTLKEYLYNYCGFREYNLEARENYDAECCFVEEDREYRGYPAKVETHLSSSLGPQYGKVEWVSFYETCVTYVVEVNGATVTIAEILSRQPRVDLSDENFVVEENDDYVGIYPNRYQYKLHEHEKLLKYQTLEGRIPETILIQYVDEERNLRFFMMLEGFEEIPTTEWILSFANIEK